MVCQFKDLRSFKLVINEAVILSYANLVDEVDILVSWSSVMPHLRMCVFPCTVTVLHARDAPTDCPDRLCTLGGIVWSRVGIGSSLWLPIAKHDGNPSPKEVRDWWSQIVLSGKMDNQIKGSASSLGWKLDVGGTLPSHARDIIANLPREMRRHG